VSEVDLAVEPKDPDRSTGEIVGSVAARFGELVNKELQLARVQMTDEIRKGATASAYLVAGGLVGYLALTMLTVAAALWLDEVLHPAVAFAIVAAAWAVVAAVVVSVGRNRLRDVNPVPQQTIESVKEDVQWARTQTS
jgi:Na+/glutamate symporter